MNYSRRLKPTKISKLSFLVIALALLASLFNFFASPKSYAAEDKNDVNLYLFWGDGCPHCARAKTVIEPYIDANANIGYKPFEVYYNPDNQKLMKSVGEALNIDASGVPLIVVGDKPYIGFSDTTGNEIKNRLEYCTYNACPDSVASIVGVVTPAAQNYSRPDTDESSPAADNSVIELPLIGKINTEHFSLPFLTAIFGLLDGFNPCAMWALLFMLTLLIGMNDRRKMWLYGSVFIAVSALVYFIFMAAWLNLFLFIGHIFWIRLIIGLLAVGISLYYLYDWYQNKTGCAVTGNEKRKEVFVKLRQIIKEKSTWLALGGIAVLAAAVNVVELACSAGLPVLYTGILSSAGLATWQYYAYMALYILFFMLDDLVVFAIAMKTFKVVGIDSKYTRITRLIGGIVLFIIGLLLIFAPQVLMFG